MTPPDLLDPVIVRLQLDEALAELAVKDRELSKKEQELRELQQRFDKLIAKFFGPRAEKFHPGQLALMFQGDEEYAKLLASAAPYLNEAPDGEATEEEEARPQRRRRKKRKNGRVPLPEHLRRERQVIDPPDQERYCTCCNREKDVIGEEVTEELEYRPASHYVRQIVRRKFACKVCQSGVVIADLPARPIEKGRPGPGLLAHVAVSKYNDHLPLNRQSEIFRRNGVDIGRSTLCDWVAAMAKFLAPVFEAMKREILATHYVNADETPIRVLLGKGGPGKTKEGRIWAYASCELREVVYDFSMARAGAVPEEFLRGFTGHLQVDAWSGFDRLFGSGDVVELGCAAHMRRYFYEARSTSPAEATLVLAVIRALYRIEDAADNAGLVGDARTVVRQREAVPIWKSLREFLEGEKPKALPESPLGKAITYALNHWDALVRYTENGRFNIDNNLAERALRSVAVGRQNWLFAGSPAGGDRAAVLYSLVQSCRLLAIEPFEYLRDVIDRLPHHPMSRVAELTPHGWKKVHAPAGQNTG